ERVPEAVHRDPTGADAAQMVVAAVGDVAPVGAAAVGEPGDRPGWQFADRGPHVRVGGHYPLMSTLAVAHPQHILADVLTVEIGDLATPQPSERGEDIPRAVGLAGAGEDIGELRRGDRTGDAPGQRRRIWQ